MSLAAQNSLEAENRALREQNEILRYHNDQLREIVLHACNPTMAAGRDAESLILRLIRARRAKAGASYDLELAMCQLTFEVKWASLRPLKGNEKTKRWSWTKIFGESGKKTYDRLLLVGESDERFSMDYAEPRAWYVLFDVPYEAAIELAGGIRAGRYGRIDLTSNRAKIRAIRARALWDEYHLTTTELRNRYPGLHAEE